MLLEGKDIQTPPFKQHDKIQILYISSELPI